METRKPGQRLKKLQQRFIDAGVDFGKGGAMEQLGLSRFTFYAWLRNPDFRQRYEEKLASYPSLAELLRAEID